MYKAIILLLILYGFEIWSLALMEVHRTRVFENRVLRRMCGPDWQEVIGNQKKFLMRNFSTRHHIRVLLGLSNQVGRNGLGM